MKHRSTVDRNITSNTLAHNPRRVTDMDLDIGARLRLARIAVGLSQTAVADHLGVTFQQIQKYERGANRISATTLSKIAALLGVSILYFFDDEAEHTSPSPVSSLARSTEGRRLLASFAACPASVRAAVLRLLEATRANEDEEID